MGKVVLRLAHVPIVGHGKFIDHGRSEIKAVCLSENHLCKTATNRFAAAFERRQPFLPDGTLPSIGQRNVDQLIGQALMIAFAMIMRDVLGHSVPKAPFAKWDNATETFLFDGPEEALSVGIAFGARQGVCTTRMLASLSS